MDSDKAAESFYLPIPRDITESRYGQTISSHSFFASAGTGE